MQIAVTGSSGLIGTALCTALGDDGHEVRRVVRSKPVPAGAIGWDPAAGEIDAAGFEGVDVVVHLAGAGVGDKRWTEERKREIHDSRSEGTSLLTRTLAGLDRPPKVLLSASGIHYYGDRGDEVVDEDSAPGNGGFLPGLVRDWEAATAPAGEAGIRTVCCRNGIVLAAHGGALAKMLPLFRLGLGGRFGSGKQWMSWIALDDMVEALVFLMEHDEISGPVNMVAPHPVTNRELTAALSRALHRPALVPVPRFGPALLMGKEMTDAMLFDSIRVEPARLTAAGFRFLRPDIDACLQAILAG